MNSREKVLVGILSACAISVVGYFFFVVPLQAKTTEIADLEKSIKDDELALMRMQKDLKRLRTALTRGLPADLELARREYDAAISAILRDAKVPATSVTVKPILIDTKDSPELPSDSTNLNAPKLYAYSRVGVTVSLKRIKLSTLLDVLRRYYQLGVLHQITKFKVQKDDTITSQASPGDPVADQSDLNVEFTTEAISLYGAEPRRTLLSIPPEMAAVGGGAGFALLNQSPLPARGITPMQLAQVLAEGNRDYSLMLVRDIFHGPPPPPKPEVVVEPEKKDDTSAFIKLTSFGRNSDGSGSAMITDMASRQEYFIDVSLTEAGTFIPIVIKSFYTPEGERQSNEPETTLEISEPTSSTRKLFTILGLTEKGLILGVKSGGRNSKVEKVVHWTVGDTLKRVKPLPDEEKAAILKQANSTPNP